MANWTNRLMVGAAVLAVAPITARLAVPSAGSSETPQIAASSGHLAQHRRVGSSSSAKNPNPAVMKQTDEADELLDPASAEQIAAAETQREFSTTLCPFLEQYGGSTPTPEGAELCSEPADGAVEAMIAVLPDPVHTHLALRFDRAVDDLQNTAQQLGWLFHRAWLPWGDLQNEDGSLRFQEKAVDAAMLKRREEQPGLLLFRRGLAKRPLVVLVVGDTPTAGVSAAQFNAALGLWLSLHAGLPLCGGAPCAKQTARRLMVLGPTFTGSVDSLQSLLKKDIEELTAQGTQCPAAEISVTVSSGTMTTGDKFSGLESFHPKCGISINAISFAEDSLYERSYLLRFLDGRLHSGSQVAEVTEEESGFGAQLMDTPEEVFKRLSSDSAALLKVQIEFFGPVIDKGLKQAIADRAKCEVSGSDDDKEACRNDADHKIRQLTDDKAQLDLAQSKLRRNSTGQHNLASFFPDFRRKRGDLLLKFPRGISLLRQAYAQSGILGFGGGETTSAPRTELSLSMQEDTRDDDAVPQFAGSQSAASMESRMAQLAATLVQKQVAVVVLSATDVLDEIFVARYLQAHAPSVTVVIQDADILFLRGGTDASMDGIYVVSPYPLIPENVAWSHDEDSPLQEMPTLPPSQGDRGTENATRYLLCGGGRIDFALGDENSCGWKDRANFNGQYLWMNEYEPPFSIGQTSSKGVALRPPLWLSVIGHGGFQPISLLDVDQQDADFPASSYNLPRLGTVVLAEDNRTEEPIPWTQPAGIDTTKRVSCGSGNAPQSCPVKDESLVQIYVCALLLGLLLGLNGWAVCRCRLNRQFFWSYAAADMEPWAVRLMALSGLGLLGIYALSLLLIYDQNGLQMEPLPFKVLLIVMQVITAAVNGVGAWRLAADPRRPFRQVQVTVGALVVSGAFVLVADKWLWQMLVPSVETFSERNFFFFRSAYPLNGASPLLPMLLLVVAMALWMRGRLGKLVFYGKRIPKLPTKGTDVRCPCGEWTQDLEGLLGRPVWRRNENGRVNWPKLLIALAAVALVCGVVRLSGQWGPRSLAFTGFDALVDVLSLGIAIVAVHNLVVAFLAWRLLKHEVLMPLKQSPLRWGFSWIKGFSWKRLWTSPDGFSPEAQLEYVMRNIEAERRGAVAAPESLTQTAAAVLTTYSELVGHYGSLTRQLNGCSAQEGKPAVPPTAWRQRAGCTAGWADQVAVRLHDVYITLAEECDVKLTRLKLLWATDYGPLTGDVEVRGRHNGQDPLAIQHEAERTQQLQRQADEEFVAMVYLTYIRSVLVQIRDRIGTSAGLYVLLLWALTGYPWMDRHGILLEMSALLGLLAVVAILIYAEMQKDDILSRTTETEAGKLDGEFFFKILSVVGIPALTLVASQFPEFSSAIFSWLMPGLSSVK